MANVSEHYVSIHELTKIADHIMNLDEENSSIESKITAKLDSIKGSIVINGKKANIKNAEIEKQMNMYTENYIGCANSFKAVSERYKTSVDNAASYVKNNM